MRRSALTCSKIAPTRKTLSSDGKLQEEPPGIP
jgi:hypothetical protein